MNAFERMPERARDVREELQKLRSIVEQNERAAPEQNDERERDDDTLPEDALEEQEGLTEYEEKVKEFLERSVLPAVQRFQDARKEIAAQPGMTENEKYKQLLAIEHALVGDALSNETISLNDLLMGLTEGKIGLAELETMKAHELDDELEALRQLMTFGEKIEEGIGNFLERTGLKNKLEAFGMQGGEAIAFIMAFLAKALDRIHPILGRNLREYMGKKKAKAEGFTDAEIEKGVTAWRKQFDEWIKKGPETTDPEPDLLTVIQEANAAERSANEEAERSAAENAEREALMSEYKAAAEAIFTSMEIDTGETMSVERTGGSPEIKVTITPATFEKDTEGTVQLTTQGQELKTLADTFARIPDLHKVSLSDAFEVKQEGDKTEARVKTGDAISEDRLKNATMLVGGRVSTLKIDSINANAGASAKLENGILLVSYRALDAGANQNELKTKIEEAILSEGASKRWTHNGSEWAEAEA